MQNCGRGSSNQNGPGCESKRHSADDPSNSTDALYKARQSLHGGLDRTDEAGERNEGTICEDVYIKHDIKECPDSDVKQNRCDESPMPESPFPNRYNETYFQQNC